MQSSAGVFIDIDGVVLHGGKPFEWSKSAIHTLWSNEIPFMFVTNGTYCSSTLVNNLQSILELPFTSDHIVVAPSPCSELNEFHEKHVLVCCQDSSIGLIPELGFKSYTTIAEIAEIFPELDFVDHNKRKNLLSNPLTEERQKRIDDFKPIEAIFLLGEPINWESSLQLIIDLLMTNGDPRSPFTYVPYPHLPLIVCNKDLTFKGAAALPRFGHGAFLECLEALYFKITKNELVYDHIMGKPYLVTYEYAANKIQKQAKPGQKIDKFFIIGDNPDVDIKGANLYKEHLLRLASTRRRPSLIWSHMKAFDKVESILVCTGVYSKQSCLDFHLEALLLNDTDCNNNVSEEGENKNRVAFYQNSNNSSTASLNTNANSSSIVIDKHELKRALSRKNSFIQYFEDRYNQPDLCVDNLLDAVNYIVGRKILMA